MTIIRRNDDVFALSGAEAAGHVRTLQETSDAGAHPFLVVIIYAPQGESSANVSLNWNPVSEARRHIGDLVDLTLTVQREGDVRDGDVLAIRFPLNGQTVADPVFAAIGAASFRTSQSFLLIGAEIGFGTNGNLKVVHPFKVGHIGHMTTAWHFVDADADAGPFMELRFHLRKSTAPLTIRCARVFAGHNYDPYAYNPAFEKIAHFKGRPEFPGASEILEEFTQKAIAASQTKKFLGMQSFVRPFLVMREGAPRFPMLIGTLNSMLWYGIDPAHGCETYQRSGYIEQDDVTLDCGAHAGQMSALFGLIGGDSGSVTAFDPFPQNCYQIEAQARLNGLTNLRAVMSGVGLERDDLSVSINGQQTVGSETAHTDLMKINIVPLDDFIDLKPTFLKVDVEGADVAAMLGAQKLMRGCKPKILVELHTQFIGQFGHTLTDFFNAIPSDIYRVQCQVEGVDYGWRDYHPGLEDGVTQPMLIWATPH